MNSLIYITILNPHNFVTTRRYFSFPLSAQMLSRCVRAAASRAASTAAAAAFSLQQPHQQHAAVPSLFPKHAAIARRNYTSLNNNNAVRHNNVSIAAPLFSLARPCLAAAPAAAATVVSASARAFASNRSESVSREGDPNDVAFTMEDVSKRIDGKRVLFKDITTGFFHGAKVGILGKNGAGKSSLLKIMAGVDKDYDGKAEPTPGKKVGYLAQEPVLDETKSVLENVMDGVRAQKDLLDRYDAIGDDMADPDADMDALIDEQAALQAQIGKFLKQYRVVSLYVLHVSELYCTFAYFSIFCTQINCFCFISHLMSRNISPSPQTPYLASSPCFLPPRTNTQTSWTAGTCSATWRLR